MGLRWENKMLWKIMAPTAMLFAALPLTVPGVAAMQAETAPSGTVAEIIAAGLQDNVGKPDENGFMMASATAQANMLVVVLTGPDGWREGLDRDDVSQTFVSGFCSEAAMLFDGKFSMRVDSIDNKVTQQGLVVKACPTPDE